MENAVDSRKPYKYAINNQIGSPIVNSNLPMENPSISLEANDLRHNIISLALVEKERLYAPWKHSVIIKIFGRKLTHQYLKTKLMDLWASNSLFALIELGLNFYTVKFNRHDGHSAAMQGVPWFVAGQFLSVKN